MSRSNRRNLFNHHRVYLTILALLAGSTISFPCGADSEVPEGTLQFVESWPCETDLDLPDLPEAAKVWLEMIEAAQHSIDIETFYISARPDAPGALAPVLEALAAAADHGVRIRVLSDAGFYQTYPEIVDRLGNLPGAESRLLDVKKLWGGVLHAKFFLVDGEQFFLGSQNWDWRALEHNRELGVRIQDPGLTAELQNVFEFDWSLAGILAEHQAAHPDSAAPGRKAILSQLHQAGVQVEPVRTLDKPQHLLTSGANEVSARLEVSPQGWPACLSWDMIGLHKLMDSAQSELRLQLLSYNPSDREGNYYPVLDGKLRMAAARGVQVKIILANWAKRPYMLPYIQSLAVLPNVEIRFTNYPEWSGGFVPYARVEHAKFLVADSTACWLGTANWARSYFHESRNVSLFLEGAGVVLPVVEFFERGWHSEYAETVEPCGEYEPPRIGR